MGGCVGTSRIVRDPKFQQKNSQYAIDKKFDRLSTETSKLKSNDLNPRNLELMEQVALLEYFNAQMSSKAQTSRRERFQPNQEFTEVRRKNAQENHTQSDKQNKTKEQQIPSWICKNIKEEEEIISVVSMNRNEIKECGICMIDYASTENRLPMMICMNQHTYCKECVTKIACKDSLCPIDRIPFNVALVAKNRLIMNALRLH